MQITIKSGNKIKQNQLKKIRKEMSQIETKESNNFQKSLDNYKHYHILQNNYDNYLQIIENYPNIISNDLQKNIKLLKDNGFIHPEENKITLKGIYASETSEANELLLSELVANNLLNDLNHAEIVALLSLFIHEGNGENSDILPKEYDYDKKVVDLIYYIQDIANYYIKQEEINTIQSDSNWSLNFNMTQVAYLWAQGKSIYEVYKYMEIYEGNFIRSMIQINNLVQSLMNICEMNGNHDLYKVLEPIENLLIRDIVTLDSIYIHI